MDLDSLIRTLEAGEGDCLKSEKIALQLEQGKRALDIRKELAPKISKLLSNAEQYLRTRLRHEEFKHKDKARLEHNLEAIINAQRLYKSGKRIAINNLTFSTHPESTSRKEATQRISCSQNSEMPISIPTHSLLQAYSI